MCGCPPAARSRTRSRRAPEKSKIKKKLKKNTWPSVTILTVRTKAFLVNATCHHRWAAVLGVLAHVPESPSIASSGEDPTIVAEWRDRPPSARLLPGIYQELSHHMGSLWAWNLKSTTKRKLGLPLPIVQADPACCSDNLLTGLRTTETFTFIPIFVQTEQ